MRNVAVFVCAAVLACVLPAQAEDPRGLNSAVQQLAGQDAAVGTQYAVLIAVDRYKSWNALRHPVQDAREIREILARRYYVDRFIELYDGDATKAGIIRLFNQLIVTTRPEDGVFIFYAGHGHLDQMSDTGFWIPADGGLDRFAQDNWLPNSQVRGFISKMKARHVVLMSDSCFSGDILNPTRAITPEITNEYFKNAYSRISRQVLTSGASEAVPDASAFARGLKQALEGNTALQLDPLMLYNQIRLGMEGTTPLLGDLKDSGHQEGASFLFFLKGAEARASGEEAAPAGSEPAFIIEKSHGTILIETRAAGRFFLDGKEMGTIPAGGTAKLERLEAGPYVLSMLFDDDQEDVKTLYLQANDAISIRFERSVPDRGSIPSAAIKIDGTFEDWKEVPPLFVKEPPGKSGEGLNLKIAQVSVARDAEYLYVRFEIADQTKPTFFHPYNFCESELTSYQVFISKPGDSWVTFAVDFDKSRSAWTARVFTGDTRGMFKQLGLGTHKKKGSVLEARFPLSGCRGLIEEGAYYPVTAQAGYTTLNPPNNKWRRTDLTETKQLGF